MGIQQIPLPAGGVTIGEIDTSVANNQRATKKFTKISEYKSTNNVSSITFSNIPQTYTALFCQINGLFNNGVTGRLEMRINNDANNARYIQQNYSSAAGQGATTNTNDNVYYLSQNTNIDQYFQGFFELPNYTTSDVKLISSTVTHLRNETGEVTRFTTFGAYKNGTDTDAITSLLLKVANGNINISSNTNLSIILYGVN